MIFNNVSVNLYLSQDICTKQSKTHRLNCWYTIYIFEYSNYILNILNQDQNCQYENAISTDIHWCLNVPTTLYASHKCFVPAI